MVASTSEHLEKLARGGVLMDTVKGHRCRGASIRLVFRERSLMEAVLAYHNTMRRKVTR
jgi:hypothetical protein